MDYSRRKDQDANKHSESISISRSLKERLRRLKHQGDFNFSKWVRDLILSDLENQEKKYGTFED